MSLKPFFVIPNFSIFPFLAKAGVCRPPLFNEKAAVSSDCLRCFCFGVTETCYSSNLHTTTVSTSYNTKNTVKLINMLNKS